MTNRLKRTATIAKACAMALGWTLASGAASDAALYWDTNGGTSGSGGPAPSGTWDTVTSNWTTDSGGLLPTKPWTPGETALFSAGSDATGQFTVTVNGTQTASEIDFLSGQQVVLAGGGINMVGGGGRISVSTGANALFQFVLGGNSGLFLSGGGLLTLASANTYTGATSVAFTSLALQDSAALGSTTGVSVGGSSALLLSGAGLNIPKPITLINGNGPTGLGALRNVFNNNTYSGNITLGGTGTRIQSDAGTLTLSGTIDGHGQLTIGGAGNVNLAGSIQTGTDGVMKVDSGVFTLTGSSTNTGTYTVAGGTIKLAASERIANSAPVNLSQTATLDMANFSETVGSLSGAIGSKIFDLGGLTVGGDGSSTTFPGVMSGNGNLTKVGSGTLTLSGANLDTGTTTISAGVISVSGVGAHLGGNQAIVANGAALILGNNAVVNVPITINGSGINNTGAIRRLGNDTGTYSGPITLGSAARIGSSNSTLIVSGATDNKGFDLTLGGEGLISFSGSITGKGGLIKEGTDVVLLLNSTNTYTGSTTVSAGKLLINAPGSIVSPVTVNSGGTLGGTGTINNSVTINPGGHLAPGASPGTLTLGGDLTLASQAAMAFELGPVNASDKIVLTSGTLHLNGQQFSDFTFTRVTGFTADTYTLIDAAGIDGSLGPEVSGMIGGSPATLAIQGNDLVLVVTPEPGNLLLAAAGFSVTGALRRRRFS